MRHRRFRQVSSGRFLQAVLTTSADFGAPIDTHRQAIAARWGLPLADVEGMDAEGAPPPEPPDVLPQPVDTAGLAARRDAQAAQGLSDDVILAAFLVVLDGVNQVRQAPAQTFPAVTAAQFKAAVRAKLDTL